MSRSSSSTSPQPHTAVVTLNRPDRLNAMSIELVIELDDALEEVADDNDIWVVVLTGAGRGVLLGTRPQGLRHHPEHRRAHRRPDRGAVDAVLLAADPHAAAHAPAGHRRGQRPRVRRRHVPRARRRAAHRVGVGDVQRHRHRQRAHQHRARARAGCCPRLVGAAHSNDMLLTGREVDADEALPAWVSCRVCSPTTS